MMSQPLPLSALLSQVLVAFVIEFDNEFERQVPHRTTNHGATGYPSRVPWLVSMPLWFRFLRFVPTGGISVGELQRTAGFDKQQMKMWLTRVSKWWGYVFVSPSGQVQPTRGGEKALLVWNRLNDEIERRWAERYSSSYCELRRTLENFAASAGTEPADVVISKRGPGTPPLEIVCRDGSIKMLPVLLGNVLARFQGEYEGRTGLSLALPANLLRLMDTGAGVRIRDLPRLSGVSKEAVAMLVKIAEKRGYVTVDLENRARVLRLTNAGKRARTEYERATAEIEERWRSSFGAGTLAELRAALERLTIPADGQRPAVFSALDGYPDGWRASLPAREVLPHCPMVSHRGGFPDGS
ncbi:MAG TPA: MarR family winged helix-turn-helix transcriptional regulator [Bryobacteraceae bacterium]|nr:MarR family winged helix-turn-helix transcriptional regulator [Bryobacteraceae bacterium]